MPISSVLGSSALLPAGLGMRNKVINGDMRVHQRGTASITASASKQFVVDRWTAYNNVGTVICQRSTTAPPGFSNSIQATVTGPGTYGTGSTYTELGYKVEAADWGEFAWGTANAKTLMASFWVRSSIAGTYDMTVQNGGQTWTYVATYTVNTADTWEYKTIKIPGPTVGTWPILTSTFVAFWFNLGMGTAYHPTSANSWINANRGGGPTHVKFAENINATFYLTGFQLEQNEQPTPFERRPLGVETALCQRYYEKYDGGYYVISGVYGASAYVNVFYKTRKRATPSVSGFNAGSFDGSGLDNFGIGQAGNAWVLTTWEADCEL